MSKKTKTQPIEETTVPESPALQVPRPGSKQALVVERLSRSEGATLPELIEATGWLPHTARAALTGLRKRGYAIERIASEDGSTYRITVAEVEKEPAPKRRGRRPVKATEAQAAA